MNFFTYATVVILIAIVLVSFGCKSRKNTDYVIITTEARRLQGAIREVNIDELISADKLLREASYDGAKRWITLEDGSFLFRSINKHSVRATSPEKAYYYIKFNGNVVMMN